MRIRVISVGKIKDDHVKSLVDDYISRINKFIKCEHILIKESKICQNPSPGDIQKCLKEEAEIFESYLVDSFNIAMCINSQEYDSLAFANQLNKCLSSSSKNINFFIGSSHGIDTNLLNKMDLKLSFSKLTIAHQLFQIVLCEQIYRALTILNNHTYHK